MRDYWLGGNVPGGMPTEGSDIGAIEQGYMSVTPLKLDMTDTLFLQGMSDWELG